MATESPGEAHAGDGVDLASGNDSDTPTDAEGVGGDTDDEVPEGENYFGRASKEGAAPAGANPFAAASSAPEDDWATQIAEAKAMVEAQRIARYDATFVLHHGAKTFEQYKRGADGNLKIVVHHSSVPFAA